MKCHSCCVICGMEAVGWHGYIVFVDSHEEYAGWCKQHINENYANPIFENQQALERFKQQHPIIYGRRASEKEVIFLQKATVTMIDV